MTDTPAASSAEVTAVTSAVVNWCRTAWLPSRRVLSVSRTNGLVSVVVRCCSRGVVVTWSPPSIGPGLRDQLAGTHRGGRHDVQVSGPLGQVVAVPADLQEHRRPGRCRARAGSGRRTAGRCAACSRARTAAPSATIAWIDSVIASRSASGPIAQNTVSRMIIGGVTGFRMMIALPLAAPPTASMACEVVSVNSSMLARVPGPADREAIDATISAYGTGGHPGHRVHHRDGRLAAAGDHVDVRRPGVHVGVDRRADERADRGRGQVDRGDAGGGVPVGVGQVGLGRRRLEHQVRHLLLGEQPVHPAGARLDAERAGPCQTVGGRVDADHVPDVDELGAQQLDEQVGADVAGADDGGGGPGRRRPAARGSAMGCWSWRSPVLPDSGVRVGFGKGAHRIGAGDVRRLCR